MTESRPARRILHLVRDTPSAALCGPEPADRVVHLTDLDSSADAAPALAELVTLIFEHDAVVVW